MQFLKSVAVLGLAAFAVAAPQDAATSAASAVSTSAASSVAPAGPQNSCVLACNNDICCQAKCVGVPCPNDDSANATTECAMKCVQGDGSEAETAKYAACQQDCIKSNFFSATAAGGAAATGTSGSDNTATSGASDSAATASSGTESSTASRSPSSTATGTAAAASGTGAASSLQIGSSAAGLVGLVVVALAL